MQRGKFSREFKVEAVRLVRERGVSVAQAGQDLNVHENVLRKWVNEFCSDPVDAFPGHGQMKPEQLEIERRRREIAKIKAERDILKKGRGLLREGSDIKFVFIAKHRAIWPVAWLCEAMGVSRSGFHAWLNRSPSARSRSDDAIGIDDVVCCEVTRQIGCAGSHQRHRRILVTAGRNRCDGRLRRRSYRVFVVADRVRRIAEYADAHHDRSAAGCGDTRS
jgi:transposase-like protein